jgi:hypothetical protein
MRHKFALIASLMAAVVIIGILSITLVIRGHPEFIDYDPEIDAIYPTKPGGREWYMDMNQPVDLVYFDPQIAIAKNEDGSWRVNGTNIRMTANTPVWEKPWRDVEMTGFVRLISAEDPRREFTWFARGGEHSLDNPCEGSAYKGSIEYDGSAAYFKKELWYGGGDVGYTDRGGEVRNPTPPLYDRWIGFKVVIYNMNNDTAVKMESYIKDGNFDQSVNNKTGGWRKVVDMVDSGDWVVHNPAPGCINPITGQKVETDEIISWGGSMAVFRADDAVFDFKELSVREIYRPLT